MSHKINHTPHPWEFDPENYGQEFHAGFGICAPTAQGSVAHIPATRFGSLTPAIENKQAEGDAQLVALAPATPHDCDIEGCPGRENKRRLEAAERLSLAAKDTYDVLMLGREFPEQRIRLLAAIKEWEGKEKE